MVGFSYTLATIGCDMASAIATDISFIYFIITAFDFSSANNLHIPSRLFVPNTPHVRPSHRLWLAKITIIREKHVGETEETGSKSSPFFIKSGSRENKMKFLGIIIHKYLQVIDIFNSFVALKVLHEETCLCVTALATSNITLKREKYEKNSIHFTRAFHDGTWFCYFVM